MLTGLSIRSLPYSQSTTLLGPYSRTQIDPVMLSPVMDERLHTVRNMSIEIIHHQRNLFGMFIRSGDRFEKSCSVLFCPLFGYPDKSVANQWFHGNKNVTSSLTSVFVIIACQIPEPCRYTPVHSVIINNSINKSKQITCKHTYSKIF